MNPHRKIVFTGLGAVCGAGRTVDKIFAAIVGGKSAIKEIVSWDASRWPVGVAAECGVENRVLVADRKLHKSISRTDLFGLYAADCAIQQSGLAAHREKMDAALVPKFNDRSGIFAGSGGGNYGCNYDFLPAMAVAGGDLKKFGQQFADSVNPMWLLRNLPNNVLCHVGIRHQFKGERLHHQPLRGRRARRRRGGGGHPRGRGGPRGRHRPRRALRAGDRVPFSTARIIVARYRASVRPRPQWNCFWRRCGGGHFGNGGGRKRARRGKLR